MSINWKHLTLKTNTPSPQSRWSAWVKWSAEDNCYIAFSPKFRHITTHGDTKTEAINELRIALTGVIDVYREMGWTLPDSLSG